MAKINVLNSIKSDFLARLQDEDNLPTYNDVIEFGTRLQVEAGMDPRSAAHTLTSWAVDAGCFDGQDLKKVEDNADDVLENA